LKNAICPCRNSGGVEGGMIDGWVNDGGKESMEAMREDKYA